MEGLLRGIDRLMEVLGAIGVLSYCTAAAVSVADVIGRRFGMPVVGVVDLVQLFVMAGAWLCIPWGFAAGAHVGVDFLLERMPAGAARGLQAVAAVIAAAVMALVLWKCFGAWQMQALLGDKSQQLGIPMSYFWVPLLVGAAASMLAALAVVIRLASGRAVMSTQAH
ncbi:TRAP transporter small permease [Paracoccus aeridis]|uniref:TRAP transporter small permease n=1 Tax=Paracoccus aeridis TaxID=1966466 RepID=UPI00191BD76F|nr:TRAP transporter small permease subunit [Paracoccus aeridis]